ncbi:MAG: sensor histidine kinase [Lachnospiraceae bacterium]|nr:sensor histidine kinase [Lachnospiraceae bacterium]
MDESRYSGYTLVVMKNLNLVTILYIAFTMYKSLSGYVREDSALAFLSRVYQMPMAGWKVPVVALGLYASLLLLLVIQNESSLGLFLKVCLELGLSFCISYVIGFSYTGTVLLILADAMRYFPKSKGRLPFAVFISIFYLLTDYNLLSAYFKITPIEAYLGYYQNEVGFLLLGIKNVLASLNMLVFLVYIILLVRLQFSEKERVLALNGQLNDANEELRQANMQLEEYAKESEKAAETRERNRLAREIHDTLGHALTGIITGIEACTALMDVAPEATKEQLKAIAEVARQGIKDVRRSVKALRPDALEKMDLEKALAQTIQEMRKATNAEISYQCTADLNCLNEDEENIIYRIVQECITNSIRHGKAREIWVRIDREYQLLKICIRDNGIGCAEVKKGFGLHHMKERLDLLGGSLAYHGEDGFTVEAKLPIRWGMEEKGHD